MFGTDVWVGIVAANEEFPKKPIPKDSLIREEGEKMPGLSFLSNSEEEYWPRAIFVFGLGLGSGFQLFRCFQFCVFFCFRFVFDFVFGFG